jgi:hypothetical protein
MILLTSTVQSHAPGAVKVVLLKTPAIDGLLSEDITTAEQNLI